MTARGARVTLRLTAAELATLRSRAGAHRTTVAAFVRAAALRGTPGGATPDAWWDTLPASRKAQVHGWLTRPDESTPAVPGQLSILD